MTVMSVSLCVTAFMFKIKRAVVDVLRIEDSFLFLIVIIMTGLFLFVVIYGLKMYSVHLQKMLCLKMNLPLNDGPTVSCITFDKSHCLEASIKQI